MSVDVTAAFFMAVLLQAPHWPLFTSVLLEAVLLPIALKPRLLLLTMGTTAHADDGASFGHGCLLWRKSRRA